MRRASPLALGALLLAAAGCSEPILDDQMAALPDEVPGIPKGPMHRGGQPCTVCHSDEGGRHPIFTIAGTVYQKKDNTVPIEGVDIQITDATGASYTVTSNCAGNFYIEEVEWAPTFPVFVNLSYAPYNTSFGMYSKIGRDSSCAFCHTDPAGPSAPGHLYVTSNPTVANNVPPPLDCGR